jgi:pimeloyl-ACP methyl ester carboxylesterase
MIARWIAVLAVLGALGCTERKPKDSDKRAYPELAAANPWRDLLGTHTLADRGTLLGGVHAATFTREEVAHNPFVAPQLGPVTHGYHLFVMQYVSEGRKGVARAMTALLYLPSGEATKVPIVAVEHGGSGVGPTCGPTHVPVLTDPLAIPLVARGYAVIAPDYPGMGVDSGMTSFLVGAAEAAATLDGVRALRQFHDPRFDAAQLGAELFVAGHSQGGHAALFTHQRFDPSIGVRFLGSVAIAPGLGSVREWAAHFANPARPMGGLEALALMSLYSHMLHANAPAPETWLLPGAVAKLPAIFHDFCQPQVPAAVAASFPTLGDVYQPSFLAAAASCQFEGGCPGFEPWATALAADQPGRITSEVPSLVLHGLADNVVSPSSVACIVDRMKAGGTPVQACGFAGADHFNVLSNAVPAMVRWIDARRKGTTPAACAAPLDAKCLSR